MIHFFSVEGRRVGYHDSGGNETPVLLLHGLGSRSGQPVEFGFYTNALFREELPINLR